VSVNIVIPQIYAWPAGTCPAVDTFDAVPAVLLT
jgi:hypothetical protein